MTSILENHKTALKQEFPTYLEMYMQKWWLDFAVKLQFFKPGLLHIFQSDSMLSEFLHFFQAICFRSLAFYGLKPYVL